MTKRICFVCHGNICRSPMAEFIFKDLLEKEGIEDIEVESMATTNDDLGAQPYYLARRTLEKNGIAHSRHSAQRIRPSDYGRFDHIYVMDDENLWEIARIIPDDPSGKIEKLLGEQSIEDPWYTRNFDKVFRQIRQGCLNRLEEVINE